jgi:hypothetical protein
MTRAISTAARKSIAHSHGIATPTDLNDPAWDAILDDMPGMLIDKHYHIPTGEGIDAGIESFHGVLRTQSEPLLDQGSYTSSQVLNRRDVACSTWDPDLGPHVWAAAKA